jgi:hypothetical protein
VHIQVVASPTETNLVTTTPAQVQQIRANAQESTFAQPLRSFDEIDAAMQQAAAAPAAPPAAPTQSGDMGQQGTIDLSQNQYNG